MTTWSSWLRSIAIGIAQGCLPAYRADRFPTESYVQAMQVAQLASAAKQTGWQCLCHSQCPLPFLTVCLHCMAIRVASACRRWAEVPTGLQNGGAMPDSPVKDWGEQFPGLMLGGQPAPPARRQVNCDVPLPAPIFACVHERQFFPGVQF